MFGMLSVPTIPYEQMEFWNDTSLSATFVIAIIASMVAIGSLLVAVFDKNDTAALMVVCAVFGGLCVWFAAVYLPYSFINSAYAQEQAAANLTELGYSNVNMTSFTEFTATRDGKYITGQLVDADTPGETRLYVIELTSDTVE